MFTSTLPAACLLLHLLLFLLHLSHVTPTHALPSHPPPLNPTLTPTDRQRRPRPARCTASCRFSLCTAGPSLRPTRDRFIILGPPRTAFNRFICLANSTHPVLMPMSTGNPLIRDDTGSLIPLNQWNPPNLSRPFAARFFRARPLIPGSRPLRGIAPERSRGNQWSFLHNRCFVLPLTSFTLMQNGNPTTTTTAASTDCVAFETRAPTLHILMVWEGNGDGDLAVQEPTRDVVDFLTTTSAAGGRLNGDNGRGLCGAANFPGYTESVTYFPGVNVPSGPFVAEAWQASDCGRQGASTAWSLRAISNGKVLPMGNTGGTVTSTGNYTRAGDLVFGF